MASMEANQSDPRTERALSMAACGRREGSGQEMYSGDNGAYICSALSIACLSRKDMLHNAVKQCALVFRRSATGLRKDWSVRTLCITLRSIAALLPIVRNACR